MAPYPTQAEQANGADVIDQAGVELQDLPHWTKRNHSHRIPIDVAQCRPDTSSTYSCSCGAQASAPALTPPSSSPVEPNPPEDPNTKPKPYADPKAKLKAPPDLNYNFSFFGVKHLGLPGLKRIFNPYAHKFIRFSWTVIYVTVLLTCSYQISERVRFYITSSVGVRVTNTRNDTLKLPSVTVCAADQHLRHPAVSPTRLQMAYRNITYSDTYDLLAKTNMSIGKLWNLTRISVSNMTYGLVEGISLINGYRQTDGQIKVSYIDTTGGRCLMFNANADIKHHGYHTFLNLKGYLPENEDPSARIYQVYVHHEDDVALARFFAAVKGPYVSFSKTVFLTVKFKEIIYINQRKTECQSGILVAGCQQKCIERQIYSRLKRRCRLPYMKRGPHIHDCTTPAEFASVYEATDQVLKEYQFSKCNCPRKCHRTVYATNLEIERPSDYFLDLEVYFPENTVERLEEYEAYTLVAMFSDIGGNLGLFLGMSVLSMGEILEVILSKICGNRREIID